jgi:hypothetical protein
VANVVHSELAACLRAVRGPRTLRATDRAVWFAALAIFVSGLLIAPFWGADFYRYQTKVLFEDRWGAVASLVLLNLGALGLILALGDRNRDRTLACAALSLALASVFLLRLDTFYEAFERDLMIYATIAADLLRGKMLYVDDWDIKPPAVFWTYAAAALLYGMSPAAIWVLGLGAAVGTALACYAAGREVGGVRGGTFAALVWSLASGDLLLQANQPNVEVFINLFATTGFWMCLRARRQPENRLSGFIIGMLFAAASLYKQVALAMFVLPALSLLGCHALQRQQSLRSEIVRVGTAGATIALAWLLVAGFFWLSGAFPQFFDTVFRTGAAYAGDLGRNLVEGFGIARYRLLDAYVPLAIASTVALVFVRSRLDRFALSLLLAWAAACWLALILPGKFFPHYFQLLLPPLAVLAGWGFGLTESRQRTWMIVLAVAVLPALWQRSLQTQVPVERIPTYKYGWHGVESLETRRIGQWIGRHLPREATVFHWGAEPGMHFWSGRPPAVRFIAHFPLFLGADDERALQIERALVAELQAIRPDLVVVNAHWVGAGDRPVVNWLRQYYARTAQGPPNLTGYLLLVPK